MKMDILRCKTPEMVRKEIWAYFLAYNLLRTVMAVAANEKAWSRGKISFKGAKQVSRRSPRRSRRRGRSSALG